MQCRTEFFKQRYYSSTLIQTLLIIHMFKFGLYITPIKIDMLNERMQHMELDETIKKSGEFSPTCSKLVIVNVINHDAALTKESVSESS
jgi:hypothetical protein